MFSEFAINEHGWQIGFPLPYGGREFAILREILEEIFKEETPLPNEPPRTQQPTITTDELAAKLTSFRETLLTDIQNYIRTDKKEKELDKAFTTMQATLETIQKTRGKPYGDNSQQLSPPEDPTFKF